MRIAAWPEQPGCEPEKASRSPRWENAVPTPTVGAMRTVLPLRYERSAAPRTVYATASLSRVQLGEPRFERCGEIATGASPGVTVHIRLAAVYAIACPSGDQTGAFGLVAVAIRRTFSRVVPTKLPSIPANATWSPFHDGWPTTSCAHCSSPTQRLPFTRYASCPPGPHAGAYAFIGV